MKQPKAENQLSLLPLALPILVEQILRSLMGTVNTLMLSQYSDDAVAAVGVSNQVINIVIIASSMIASGAAVLINQHLGAKQEKEASAISMSSLFVSACVGLLFSLILIPLASPIIGGMGLEAALRPDAITYLRIVGGSCVIQFVSTMLATHFRCHGDAKKPMMVIVFTNLLNLLGCCIVVFRPFETPLHGVAGVAAVRLASELLGLGFMLFLYAKAGLLQNRRALLHPKISHLKAILRLGFFSGAEGVSFTLAQLITTSFLTGAGAVALSTKVYVQTVTNYTFLAGLSIGQASQIIAGHMLGAGKLESVSRFIKRSWFYILVCNLFFSGAVFLLSNPIIGLFSSNAEILVLAKQLLLIDIFTCAGRSMNHSFNYGLRSAGYVVNPMIVSTVSIWTISVGVGYLLTVPLGLGIFGVWIAAMLDEWIRGGIASFFWLTNRWKKSLLIKATSPPAKESATT